MKKDKNDKLIDKNTQNSEEFYSRFKLNLEQHHKFPGNYMFKFIVPTDTKTIALLQKIFDHSSASFSMKESKNAKYTSVTVTLYATDSTSVIEYYKEAASIEGIVML